MKTRSFWVFSILVGLLACSVVTLLVLAPPSTWKWRWYLHKRAQWINVPISFYGKVIDQDGRPLRGVRVVYNVHTFEPHLLSEKNPDVFRTFETVTDDNGLVKIEALKGITLSVDPIPGEGYRMNRTGPSSFAFSPQYSEIHRPDPANPIVFHMWKKGPTESLVERDRSFRVRLDDNPIIVDLLTGKRQEGAATKGDLRLSLKRPAGLLYPRTPYDWEFRIDAIDGGIVETTDVFPYRAPESGYEPGYKYALRTNMKIAGGASAVKKYYFRGRNGTFYASLDIEVNSAADSSGEPWGAFYIRYRLNPHGSRNLEPDKSKKLNP